ncbi:hypothetical protein BT93_K0543 [Corymbia citriodora subsp. variegata]|nr:hypothetical protein BT93_K0543 [Corymbia citriodora subsp. variegata]
MKLFYQKRCISNCSLLTFTTDIQENLLPTSKDHFLFKSEIMKNRPNDRTFPLFCYLLLTIFSNSI